MSDRLDIREVAGIRWLIGQVMVLVSLVGSFSIDLGATGLVSAGIGLVLIVMIFPRLISLLPALLWRIAPVVVLAVIVIDFILSGGDVLPPLFRMVVVLTLYRAVQARSPREDMQLLLLTVFLILVTGVLSLEVTFGLQMLVYAPLAMGLLFTANLSQSVKAARPADEEEAFYCDGWIRLSKRLLDRMDRRTLFAGAILFVLTTSMALALFLFLPRFDIGAALPFPRLQTAQSLTGFSDHVKYGDVVSILNDDAIAMRVDVDMESPPARPYWRMVSLDAYYDGGFMVSPKVARERRTLSDYRFDFENPNGNPAEEAVWTLYVEGGISSYLPAGDTFETLRFKNRIDLQLHDLTRVLKTNETNATTLSLRYEGLGFGGVLPVSKNDLGLIGMKPILLDTSDPGYLKDVSYPATTLVVPSGSGNARILNAALRQTGRVGNRSVREFSNRIVNYLQSGRGYSLDTRVPGGDAETVLRWVESGQDGHCELYAGAFVLISRYAGVPARLVTGYTGGDWNGYENYFMVRHRNAHAWVEVFDPAEGWIRVDPTPGYLVDPGSVESALAAGGLRLDDTWRAYLDSLKVLWFRRVIQFDSADQLEMADSVKGIGLLSFDWLKNKAEALRAGLNRDWQEGVRSGSWSAILMDLSLPAGVVGSAFVIIILIRKIRKRDQFEGLMRRRAGRLLGSLSGVLATGSFGHDQLLLIRYGPASAWPANTEQLLRQLKRQPSRFAGEREEG